MSLFRTRVGTLAKGAAFAILFATPALADVGASGGSGVFDDVADQFRSAASGWATAFTSAASFLFWGLAAISMVWTFGQLALKRSDLGEFFGEAVKFMVFTGFYFWLLTNGSAIGSAIIKSLQQLGTNASGMGGMVSPSRIVDIGFDVLGNVIDQSSLWQPVDSAIGVLIGCVILVVLALVGVNMLLLAISGWILAYAGIFFLGFGGSRWTSDIAINYFKQVLGVGASLMTMILLVGIGYNIVDNYHSSMSANVTIKEEAVMMVASIILLALVNKVPGMVAGIITGAGIGNIGNGFGAGAAVGAAGMAMAAAATGGAAIAAGAANAAGGMKALDAAFKAAAAAQGEGNSGAGAALANAVSGGDAGGSSANSGGSAGTPLASAQGDGGSNPANDNPGGTPMSHSAGDGQQPSGAADHAIAQQGQPSASGAEGGTAAPASSETTGNGSGGNGRFASAAAVAGGAAKHLAAGIARSAGNKASEIADAARERIDNTAGGRLAAEIANPGAAKAERQDRKDADAGRAMAERQQLAAEASQARAMTSSSGADELAPATGTGASKLAFDGNQISAGETEEPEASSKAATGGHGHGN